MQKILVGNRETNKYDNHVMCVSDCLKCILCRNTVSQSPHQKML